MFSDSFAVALTSPTAGALNLQLPKATDYSLTIGTFEKVADVEFFYIHIVGVTDVWSTDATPVILNTIVTVASLMSEVEPQRDFLGFENLSFIDVWWTASATTCVDTWGVNHIITTSEALWSCGTDLLRDY